MLADYIMDLKLTLHRPFTYVVGVDVNCDNKSNLKANIIDHSDRKKTLFAFKGPILAHLATEQGETSVEQKANHEIVATLKRHLEYFLN